MNKKNKFLFLYIMMSLLILNNTTAFTATTTNDKDNKKQSKKTGIIRDANDTDGIPQFPDGSEEYNEIMFDDGFSNNVESLPTIGEFGDNFIGGLNSRELNRKYISGNNESISQMDAIEAEKKTIVDKNGIDKDLVATKRTRIMAYLTQDQIIFDELFEHQPDAYYLSAIKNELL